MPTLWIQPSVVDGLNSCIVNSASRFSLHSWRTLVGIRAQDLKALQKMNTSSSGTLIRHGSRKPALIRASFYNDIGYHKGQFPTVDVARFDQTFCS